MNYPDTIIECHTTDGDGLEKQGGLIAMVLFDKSRTSSRHLRWDEVVNVPCAGNTSSDMGNRHF